MSSTDGFVTLNTLAQAGQGRRRCVCKYAQVCVYVCVRVHLCASVCVQRKRDTTRAPVGSSVLKPFNHCLQLPLVLLCSLPGSYNHIVRGIRHDQHKEQREAVSGHLTAIAHITLATWMPLYTITKGGHSLGRPWWHTPAGRDLMPGCRFVMHQGTLGKVLK